MSSRDNCDVCRGRSGARYAGVAAIPLVPMSVAYCTACLSADAHPLGVLEARIEECGGYCNDYFWDMYMHSVAFADVFAFDLETLKREVKRDFELATPYIWDMVRYRLEKVMKRVAA